MVVSLGHVLELRYKKIIFLVDYFIVPKGTPSIGAGGYKVTSCTALGSVSSPSSGIISN